MSIGTSDMKFADISDKNPVRLQRRSFLGRFGGLLAGLLAGVPLIQSGLRAAGEVSVAAAPTTAGRIRARIHPMAVARRTSRSLPNV